MVKEMNYVVVEEFLKNNPDFSLYNSNPVKRKFEKVISVKDTLDDLKYFEGVINQYIIKSNEEVVSLTDLPRDSEIYRLVKE